MKTQIKRNNGGAEVINLYLKCNNFRCNSFLNNVESLPLKWNRTLGNYNEYKYGKVGGGEDEPSGDEDVLEEYSTTYADVQE